MSKVNIILRDIWTKSFVFQVMHFLQENLMEEYHQEIRQVSGHLNVLGRMAKEDSSRAMALHLFDSSLWKIDK